MTDNFDPFAFAGENESPIDFAEAEREFIGLRGEAKVLESHNPPDEVLFAIFDRMELIERSIIEGAPTTLNDVAVKLRRLLDPKTGMEVTDAERNFVSLRQILAFVEAAVPSGPARPLAMTAPNRRCTTGDPAMTGHDAFAFARGDDATSLHLPAETWATAWVRQAIEAGLDPQAVVYFNGERGLYTSGSTSMALSDHARQRTMNWARVPRRIDQPGPRRAGWMTHAPSVLGKPGRTSLSKRLSPAAFPSCSKRNKERAT